MATHAILDVSCRVEGTSVNYFAATFGVASAHVWHPGFYFRVVLGPEGSVADAEGFPNVDPHVLFKSLIVDTLNKLAGPIHSSAVAPSCAWLVQYGCVGALYDCGTGVHTLITRFAVPLEQRTQAIIAQSSRMGKEMTARCQFRYALRKS